MNATAIREPTLRHPTDRVSIAVLSRSPEVPETLNRLLRQSGVTARCFATRSAADLEDILVRERPELVYILADDRLMPFQQIAALRARIEPPPAVLLLLDQCSESASESALVAGAQDVVSLLAPKRLLLVTERELHHQRHARALSGALHQGIEMRDGLSRLRDDSSDALAEVAEGIVIAANPAWLELTGYSELGNIDGLPVMDCFEPASHPVLRGALLAAQQDRWPSEPLRLQVRRGDGGTRPVDIALALGVTTDGDRVVTLRSRLAAASTAVANGATPAELHALSTALAVARQSDAGTGLLHRRAFAEQLKNYCAVPIAGGVRSIAVVQITDNDTLADAVDVEEDESLMGRLADILRCQLTPTDLAGRLQDHAFAVALERGTHADIERFATQLTAAISSNDVIRQLPAPLTVTVGIANLDASGPVAALRRAQSVLRQDADTAIRHADAPKPSTDDGDRFWAQRITAALMDNRFRLLRQPIASLRGGPVQRHDLLLRLQDELGQDVLPGEFLAAAARHDLLRAIDRWVLASTLGLIAAEPDQTYFMRLSVDSLVDHTLLGWVRTTLSAAGIHPACLVIQIPAAELEQHVTAALALRAALSDLGIRFAIEHLGPQTTERELVHRLRPDIVKIDGSLTQGLASQPSQQALVRDLVEASKTVGAATVAERVEDANTMAVLYALGVEFIQGRFVERSEAVTLG
jgi:EAL domain-containing protein (putative c-di-GMP-specific phosphodiesterase class I)/GGDEF domain-containing protein